MENEQSRNAREHEKAEQENIEPEKESGDLGHEKEYTPETTEHDLSIEQIKREGNTWRGAISELEDFRSKRDIQEQEPQEQEQQTCTIEQAIQQHNELRSKFWKITRVQNEKLKQANETLLANLNSLEIKTVQDISHLQAIVHQIKEVAHETHGTLDRAEEIKKQAEQIYVDESEYDNLDIDDDRLLLERKIKTKKDEVNQRITELNERKLSSVRQRIGVFADKSEMQKLMRTKEKLQGLEELLNKQTTFNAWETENLLGHLVYDTNKAVWEKLQEYYKSNIANRAKEIEAIGMPLPPVIVKSLLENDRNPQELRDMPQYFTRFTMRGPQKLERLEIAEQYEQALNELEKIFENKTSQDRGLINEEVEHTERSLREKSPITNDELFFINDLDTERWQKFCENDAARDFLRKGNQDTLEQTNRAIDALIIKHLHYPERDQSTNRIKIDEEIVGKSLELKHEQTAPQTLLGASENPSFNEAIAEYAQAMDIGKLERLVQEKTPGFTDDLLKVIKLIQENPETFHKHMIENPEILEFEEQLKEDPEFINEIPAFDNADSIVVSDEDTWKKKTDGKIVYYVSEARLREMAPDLPDELPDKIPADDPLFEHIRIEGNKQELKNARIVGSDRRNTIFATYPNKPKQQYCEVPEKTFAKYRKKYGKADDFAAEGNRTIDNPVYYEIEKAKANIAADLMQEEEAAGFSLHIIGNLNAKEFGEKVHQAIADTFKNTDNDSTRKDIRDAIVRRSTSHNATLQETTSRILKNTKSKDLDWRVREHVLNMVDESLNKTISDVIENSEESIDEQASSWLMYGLRLKDPILSSMPDSKRMIALDQEKKFNQALQRLSETIKNPEDPMHEHRDFFTDPAALRFLARQPERIEEMIALPKECPYLFGTLLKQGGPLHSNIDNVVRDIFENGDSIRRAIETETIFKQKVPFWKQLYLYTDRRIGEQLATADSEYPVTELPKIKAGKGTKLDYATAQSGKTERFSVAQDFEFITKSIKDMSVAEKQAIASFRHGKDEEIEELDQIPFTELKGVYKKMVFGYFLSQTIERSRDINEKHSADQRNRELTKEKLELKKGIYLHGSAVDNLENVLLSGNLPQEALGEEAGVDSYPFQVDFTRLQQEYLDTKPNTREKLEGSMSGGYGHTGEKGLDGQIFYIYDREHATWQNGINYSAGNADSEKSNHALIFGGHPATEINGIALRNPEMTIEEARTAVLENGFYIPIYDLDGNLLFTPEQYDKEFKDRNLSVQVETWDFSLKTGEQLGSNPGGEFTVPAEDDPEKHYVKFGERGTKEETQMWTEVIADRIYQACKIDVPESKIVRCEGSYGRSSKMFTPQEGSTPDFSKGFLVDLVTQNYWDMKPENAKVDEQGITQRLDNGASFPEYRGTQIEFDLEGLLDDALQERFPSQYEQIAREELEGQAKDIADNLTPDKVKEIVNSARLPSEMREKLEADINNRVELVKQKFKLAA